MADVFSDNIASCCLATALDLDLTEPMSDDPARDDLWREVCRSLAVELGPELN